MSEPSRAPTAHERADAIMKARHLIEKLDDAATRTVMDRAFDTYFYNQAEIDAMLRFEGNALRDEAALHIAAYFVPGIDTTDKRTWIG